MTASGLRMIDKQALGYEYLNVHVPPTNVEIGQSRMQNSDKVVVSVDFRDWKWLSQYTRF